MININNHFLKCALGTADCLKIRKRRPIKIEIEHFMYSAFHDQTKSRNMKFQDFVRLSERSVQKMFYFYFYLVLCFKITFWTIWRKIVNIIWKLWSSRAYAPTRIIWSCGTHPVGIIKFDISIFFNHFAMKFLIVFIFFFCLYSVLFFVWRCKDMARIGGSQ